MQKRAIDFYNKFSKLYDYLSPKSYYHKARSRAVNDLKLEERMKVLNVPVGTGQIFEYFQSYLNNSGVIVGVDISPGMLAKAELEVVDNRWSNIKLLNCTVLELSKYLEEENVGTEFDAIICDLGLSGFPNWKRVIDELLAFLTSGGRISIIDWYIEKPSLRGELVKWIGKGEVDRPLWQYMETMVTDFRVDSSFNRGGVFVASGTKRENCT